MNSDEHAGQECFCCVMTDPVEKLCRYCRIVREERNAERKQIEEDLYRGEG